MPDCRGYELVTPPFKNGEPPVTDASGVSGDGERIELSSLGAFQDPGNDSTPEGGEYIIKRGSSSWNALAVNPAATEFQDGSSAVRGGVNAETLDYSAGLEHTLFLKARLGARPIDARFFLDSPFAGSLSEIGPMLAPETVAAWTPQVAEGGDAPATGYVGASEDLSHVFFSQNYEGETNFGWVWPGDKTIRGTPGPVSLYEYSGTSQGEPELVGVSNEEALTAAAEAKGKPHINEAAELISECGTFLGGVANPGSPSSSDTYNAISKTGETVFFTALAGGCTAPLAGETGSGPIVAEVYARQARERTVDISEPSVADCALCSESEKGAAVFQGASRDGSRAFFLSEQRLFGGANLEEGVTLYEYDFAGPAKEKVTEIATDLARTGPEGEEEIGGLVGLSEDGRQVYFVSEAKLATNTNAVGEEAQASAIKREHRNLYLYDSATESTTFIAPLNEKDEADWSATDHRPGVEVTPDGRFLVFPSVFNLSVKEGGAGLRQLYRYEAPTPAHVSGSLDRVSIGAAGSYVCPFTEAVEEGFNCDGRGPTPKFVFVPTYARNSEAQFVGQDSARPLGVSITSDGSKVFFSSPVALTPSAINDTCVSVSEISGTCIVAAQNVYEWQNGKIYLISDGKDTKTLFRASSTKLIGADPSGANVFFTTASSLVPRDTDSQVDVYDARVEGGFAEPGPSVSCSGGCGSPELAPSLEAAATGTTSGLGNLPPAAPAAPVTKPKPLTRVQKLAKALRRCRTQAKSRRHRCEVSARKLYGKPAVHKRGSVRRAGRTGK